MCCRLQRLLFFLSKDLLRRLCYQDIAHNLRKGQLTQVIDKDPDPLHSHKTDLDPAHTRSFPHCNENPIYVFLFWELRGLSPNFHIHVTVGDFIYSQDRSTYFPSVE
jgi:hypothetical protein